MIGVVVAYMALAFTFGAGMILASLAMLWLCTRPWFVRKMNKWSEEMTTMIMEDDLPEKIEIEE